MDSEGMSKRLALATANRPGRNIFIHPPESPDSGATTMSILYRHLCLPNGAFIVSLPLNDLVVTFRC